MAGIGKYHTIVSFFFLFIFYYFFLFCTLTTGSTQRFDNFFFFLFFFFFFFLFFFSSNLLLPSSCLHFSPCHHPSYLSMIYIQYQNEFFVRMVVSHHIWNTWIKYVCFFFYFPINYYYLIMILTVLRIYDLNIFFNFFNFFIFSTIFTQDVFNDQPLFLTKVSYVIYYGVILNQKFVVGRIQIVVFLMSLVLMSSPNFFKYVNVILSVCMYSSFAF